MEENSLAGNFKDFWNNAKINDTPTTSRNPTANTICEHMHQTVGNVLRTLVHENKPRGSRQAKELVDEALVISHHSLRCGVHTTLERYLGSLLFNKGMFLNVILTVHNISTSYIVAKLTINYRHRSFWHFFVKFTCGVSCSTVQYSALDLKTSLKWNVMYYKTQVQVMPK